MRPIFQVTAAVFLLMVFPVISQAEKREDFRFVDTPAETPGVQDDWFGSAKKVRKELEDAAKQKQQEARKAEAEKRNALREKQKTEIDAEDLSKRISPRRAKKYREEEKELLGLEKRSPVAANAEIPAPTKGAAIPKTDDKPKKKNP